MRNTLAVTAVVFILSAPLRAVAEPEQTSTAPAVSVSSEQEQRVGETNGALPGVVRIATAAEMEKGGSVTGFAGYGYLGEVLGTGDSHHRAVGEISGSFRPTRWLGFALRLDGRYDKHVDVPNNSDDGWVGDPRLIARAVHQVGDFGFGAQLGLWFPGSNAPSVIFKATSVDAIALASWLPKNLPLTATINVGYRLDQSAESVDNAMSLSLADRMALGASDANSLLLGVGATYRVGPLEALAEWSWDMLIGSDAPSIEDSPMRVTGGARYHITETIAAQANLDLSLSDTPVIDPMGPLVPVEPTFRAMLGFHIQFGTGRRPKEERQLVEDDTPPPPPATLNGRVVWGGVGVAGATVRVEVAGSTVPFEATSGADGTFSVKNLPAGNATVSASADGYRPATATQSLASGIPVDLEITLEKDLPPGQFRGVVRSLSGKPLAGAKLTITPGPHTAETDAKGYFQVELPPGDYQAEVGDGAHAPQRREIHIDENGVTIYNFDLKPRKN